MRLLCTDCRRPVALSGDLRAVFERHGLPVPDRLFDGGGCTACGGTGYAGRTGLYDVVESTAALKAAIAADASEADLASSAGVPANGLFVSGLRAAAAGRTSMAEVLRVVNDTE